MLGGGVRLRDLADHLFVGRDEGGEDGRHSVSIGWTILVRNESAEIG